MNRLGNFIRQQRGDQSLREFAARCGVSHTHVDSIEKGCDPRTGKPVRVTTETLRNLARGMGVDYLYLAALAENMDPKAGEEDKNKKQEHIRYDEATVARVMEILHEEIVPAEGCTEPIAIAYVAAKAAQLLGREPERMTVRPSGSIVKNVKSVTIPGSGGMTGIEAAAAMGALAGDPDKELMVLTGITKEKLEKVKAFLKKDAIAVERAEKDINLYVEVEVVAGADSVTVEIKHTHTNVTRIVKNGQVLLDIPCADGDFNSSLADRSILSVEMIYHMAHTIDLELIRDLFLEVVDKNTRIAFEGLSGHYGVNTGRIIMENISAGVYGNDIRNRSAAFAAAGSDARMSGCALPVMTTSGSGNQGMTASLPVIQYCRDMRLGEEKMIRALFFSHLATVHIKTNVGRLSAFCGAICAAAGVSGALAMLQGGGLEEVSNAITITLGNLSGVICDGAKASCALKIASGMYAAFDAALLAMNSQRLAPKDGIVGFGIESTIQHVGELAQDGMKETDVAILGIMLSKL
ncbi:MAG: L-serine ammonia-lyase, iron-sulfur-dependent, subunit alpha [Christensenellaceae bacterium]|nr:L-serine ammonia-lyase, iron-sulfur-dependent, subunit alpha [Christensenellaceae bacterium]